MYRIVYLPTARRQLRDAALYIATELNNPDAAESLMDDVDEQVKGLQEMPYRHEIYPTLYAMKHEIRFVPVKRYLLFYVVKEQEKTVEIWRFLHQLQNTNKL